MDDYAQYSNMMSQINQINQQGRELVNEKKEDQLEKLAEYKKTLEMTTEGIGGGILHDTGINLIKKGLSTLKDKIPIPMDELEKMIEDYKEGDAKKMFQGMAKRGYSQAKKKLFGDVDGDDEDADTSVKKLFGKLFKTGKAQINPASKVDDNVVRTIGDIAPPEPIQEPNFDNVTSSNEFRVQNKLLKNKVQGLDKDLQKKVQRDLNTDTTIKKPSEIKQITDPDEKLTEQIKRGKALNDRVDAELQKQPLPSAPEEEPSSILAKAQEKLQTRLRQIAQPVQTESDTASGTKGFFAELLDRKKTQVQEQIQKAQGKLLAGGGEDDDDPTTFQQPKPLGTDIKESDIVSDVTEVKPDIKQIAKKAGEKLAETDAELGGVEDPFGDVISGLVGLGTLLGGIFGAKAKHLKTPPPSYIPLNPVFQSGA